MHTQMKRVSWIAQPLHGIDAPDDTFATEWESGIFPESSTGQTQVLLSPDFRSDSLESWSLLVSKGKRKCSVTKANRGNCFQRRFA
eukprot:3849395-Amphidinium_carterae.1